MNENLTYIITLFGCVLSLLSIRHLFFGERIPIKDNGLERIKIGKYEFKISTVLGIFLVSVITATLPFLLYIAGPLILFPGEEPSESVCRKLEGQYELRQEYIFVEKEDIRLRAKDGHWHADNCNFLGWNKFGLAGTDTTDFDIEIVIAKEFKKIATGIFSYQSKILIENGKLINRTFRLATENERKLHCVDNKENEENTCHGIEISEINNKINKALNIRDKKHKELIPKYCIPTIGKEAGDQILAFVCRDYTRVMKLVHK